MALLSTVILAFLITLVLTPVVERLATSIRFVDQPDQHRKLHVNSTALGGGIAVFGGLVSSILFTSVWEANFTFSDDTIMLLLCVGLICVLGLVDDKYGLRGRQKLLGQVTCVAALIANGLIVSKVFILGWEVNLGLLAIPFTVAWLLGATNALNLIDGMDGLATSIGLVLSLALGAMAYVTGSVEEAYIAFALAGALAGFLIFNFPPASIFLGDAGSMLIGLLLGVLAIRSSLKGPATVVMAAPIAVLTVPMLDVAMAILRRKLTGRSIYTTDRGHLHHCFLQNGIGNHRTLMWVGLMCSVTSVGGFTSVLWENELLAILSMMAVIGTLIATGIFGFRECELLSRRVYRVAVSMVPRLQKRNSPSARVMSRFQGNRDWEQLWNELLLFADRFELDSVRLNVNVPALHESFHGDWKDPQSPAMGEQWHSELPLKVDSTVVGTLRLTGTCKAGKCMEAIGQVISELDTFQKLLGDLLNTHQREDWELESSDVLTDEGAPATNLSPSAIQ